MARPVTPRSPDERYPVMLCVHCAHPGGQHVLGGGCRLCPDCPGWGEQQGAQGQWSDRRTRELLAAMGGAPACRHCGQPIAPCHSAAGHIPVCKGWIHPEFDGYGPIGPHYCGGRSVNPSAEPERITETEAPDA